MNAGARAVVIVSGGDAISPFTTPSGGCGRGLSAGSTDTGLREGLLAAGFAVYTSPANAGPGPVTVDEGFGGFAEPPDQLPESMTVNAVGPIDSAGEHLAAFLVHLHQNWGLESVSLVGHSMGGLFSRAAVRELAATAAGPRIHSLTTLGTPWEGSFAADFAIGDIPLTAAGGDHGTETVMTEFKATNDAASSGAGEQVTHRYLAGPGGWNERQAGLLDDIPVTLIGGDYFRLEGGSPDVCPHDGLVPVDSALAEGTSAAVLPTRTTRTFPDVHSIFFADAFGLAWDRALTWDPAVLAAVVTSLRTPI